MSLGRRRLLVAGAGLLATPVAGTPAALGRPVAGTPAALGRPVAGTSAMLGKPRVRIETDHGAVMVELEDRRAPISSANFLHYVDAAKYDAGAFFRTTHPPGDRRRGTIVGSPSARIRPFPPIAHEPTSRTGLRHVDGVLSLGRFATGSATSDIFICLGAAPSYDARPGAPGDDLGFAAFGRVVDGMAVVRRIHGLRSDAPSPYADQKGQWLNPPVSILRMRRSA